MVFWVNNDEPEPDHNTNEMPDPLRSSISKEMHLVVAQRNLSHSKAKKGVSSKAVYAEIPFSIFLIHHHCLIVSLINVR